MKRTRNSKIYSNPKVKYLAAIIVVVLGIALLEITNTTHFFHKSKIPEVIPVAPSSAQSGGQNGADQNAPSTASDKGNSEPESSDGNSPNNATPLADPYGNFVSNHHPSLSGSPTPSSETSVCNTTAEATCYIEFTQGSIKTKLPAQKTDSNGATYWNWDVKKAGLTKGDWSITAVATLNGESKSIKDPIALSVSK